MTNIYTNTVGVGEDLVLLHGWACNSDVWQDIVPLLAHEFRVTVIDLPGCGRSETLSNYTLQTVCQSLLEVAPEKAHWLGWSLGGLFASHIAFTSPSRVNKLINVASSPHFIASDNWSGIDPEKFALFKQSLAAKPLLAINDFFARMLRTEKQAMKFLQKLQQMLFAYGEPNLQALTASVNILQEDLSKEVSQITVPISYILGEKDPIVSVALAAHLKQISPDVSVYIMNDVGHIPFYFQPNQFVSLLKEIIYV